MRLRHLLPFLCLYWAHTALAAAPTQQLLGTILNLPADTKVILYHEVPNGEYKELQEVKLDAKGGFTLQVAADEPGFYRLLAGRKNVRFLVTPNEAIHIQWDIATGKTTYSNSPNNALIQTLQAKRSGYEAAITELLEQRGGKIVDADPKVQRARQEAREDSAYFMALELWKADIKQNLNSPVAFIAYREFSTDRYLGLMDTVYQAMQRIYPQAGLTQKLGSVVANEKLTAVGQMINAITLPDTTGKLLTAAALRGSKLTLVDFWASWCGPCRRSFPRLKGIYATYKNKGFEIVGISIDQEKESWKQAIVKDGTTWPHILDVTGGKDPALQVHNIFFIPFTLLLDGEGRILAKNVTHDQLERILAKQLGQAN